MWKLVSFGLIALWSLGVLGACGRSTEPWGELIIVPDNREGRSAEGKPDDVSAEIPTERATPDASESSPTDEPTPPEASEPPLSDAPPESSFPEEAGLLDTLAEEATPEKQAPDLRPEALPEPPPKEVAPEAPAGQAWIGEACTKDADCGYPGGRCLRASDGYPGGHCTQTCTQACPDRTGKPVTFCIASPSGTGFCVRRCDQIACRTGYACLTRSRVNDASILRDVCIPQTSSPPTSLVALHIGDSQSSGTQFAKMMVDLLRNPGAFCPGAKTAGNSVFSYGRVSSAARHWSDRTGSNKDWLCAQTTIYVNGTAPQNTTGSALCSGITTSAISVFEKRVSTHKPKAFLIQLGGNSMGFSETYVKSKIRQMLDQIPAGSLCFWATPSLCSGTCLPKHRDLERWTIEVFQTYTRLTCHALTSINETVQQTRCSSFNTSDGIHMTTCGSQLWGEIVRSKICALGTL